MALFEIVEKRISGLFSKYGKLLSRHPVIILAIALIATGILGAGLIKLENETDLEYLYTPENSRADKDRRTVTKLFPDRSGQDFYQHQIATLGLYGDVIIVAENTGDNVLSVEVLTELLELDDFVKNITVTVDNEDYGYFNVCVRRFHNCVISGVQTLINGSDIAGFLQMNLTFPVVKVGGKAPVFLANVIGGVEVDGRSIVTSAEALRVRYHLRSDDKMKKISLAWEKVFLEKILEWKGNVSQTVYAVSESLNYELNEGTSGDITYFAITIAVMSFYSGLVCGTGNCVTSRGFLANVGVASAALAILASYGFCSFIGVKNVNIVGVMPFLIIGIGIDDMFLLMSGWLQTKPSDTVEGRISGAFSAVAVSITITSITDVLAFCIGATNVFPSLRNFCIYTGFAVIWCYLMQLTVFGSAMVFHTRRVKSSRHCLTCTPVPSDDEINSGGKVRKCLCAFFCRGKPSDISDDNDQEDRSIFERAPLYLSKFIMLVPVKVTILVVFVGYLAVSIWGVVELEQGLILNNLVPSDSYLNSYLKLEREYYNGNGPVIAIVIQEPIPYWEDGVQNELDNLLKTLGNSKYINDNFRISWLDSFLNFHNQSLPTSHTSFSKSLQFDFLRKNPQFVGDLNISKDGVIKSSRFYVQSERLTSSTVEGNMMLEVRKITDNSDLPAFAYTGAFIFFEQYVQVLPSTLQTVGIAVAAIFVVCFFFIPHPLCVIYVTVTMVMILVGLFGFMHFWGLSLSSITMIHVVLSVGFSVDFSAHVCHAFMKADGTDRNHRVEVALSRVAVPILNGGISSLLGIIFLSKANSYVFLSFFRVMFLTIVFGIAHALLFLPVLLSLIGPSKSKPSVEVANVPENLDTAPSPDIGLDKIETNDNLHIRESETKD
ncbi:patched domain-containing protein 3-like [Glandiceps talaboti]